MGRFQPSFLFASASARQESRPSEFPITSSLLIWMQDLIDLLRAVFQVRLGHRVLCVVDGCIYSSAEILQRRTGNCAEVCISAAGSSDAARRRFPGQNRVPQLLDVSSLQLSAACIDLGMIALELTPDSVLYVGQVLHRRV